MISEHLGCRKICKQRAKNEHNVFLNESSVFQKLSITDFFLSFCFVFFFSCKEQQPVLALLQPTKVAMREASTMEVKRFSKSPPLSRSPNMYTHTQKTYSKQSRVLRIPATHCNCGYLRLFIFFPWLKSFRKNWTMKITLINTLK